MSPEWWVVVVVAVLAALFFIPRRRRPQPTPDAPRPSYQQFDPLATAVWRADQSAVDLREQLTTGSAETVRLALYRTNTATEQLAKLLDAREKEHRHE